MPELSLSFDLHLHHCVVSILDALQGLLDPGKQVNDLLFAEQDLTIEERRESKESADKVGRPNRQAFRILMDHSNS